MGAVQLGARQTAFSEEPPHKQAKATCDYPATTMAAIIGCTTLTLGQE